MKEANLPRFSRGDLSEAVRAAMAEHFPAHSKWKNSIAAYFKAGLMMAGAAVCYGVYVLVPLPLPQLALLAVVFGVALGGIAFNVQHDANHGAFVRSKAFNRFFALTLDVMGISSYVWRWKHNVYHHTFPNVEGADTDVEPRLFACFSPSQRRFWFHRYQHFYVWILYGFIVMRWQLIYDFNRLISGRIGTHALPRPRGMELWLLIAGKCVFFISTFAVPLIHYRASTVLFFYAVTALTLGWLSSLVFQVGHCFSETSFRSPRSDTTVDWAVHQVSTTADFARTSALVTWYFGGLNFQIEHHLFPGLPHVHYRKIAPLVEKVCREHGVPYVAYRTAFGALQSHYRFLKRITEDAFRSRRSTSLSACQGA